MPGLKLFLLGPYRLERDGALLKFDTRKNVGLISYLAMSGGSHSREALTTLLWPELESSRARAGLRRNLSVLKKTLRGEWLDVDGDNIGSDPEAAFYLDINHFRRLLTTWQEHGHSQADLCSKCLVNHAQAVVLYRGNFLEGFSLRDSPIFDEWQFFQTEDLRREFALALERLVHGLSAKEKYDRAISYARRWLTLDPFHEPAHQQLMQLYVASGQRAAALRQYDKCKQILDQEMSMSPDGVTTALYEAIKGKRPLPQPGEGLLNLSEQRTINNRYRLEAEIGRGGMGVVHQAHDLLLDRQVAIKVYAATALGTEGHARLLIEAQAAARLNHPNIVSVYDAGEYQGTSYLVSEFVLGDSLHVLRPETMGDILAITKQVCAALEHAHRNGIVHRDLKPENIIITPDGTVKLTDFGLARPVASRITSEGAIAGTVFYLAPEIALGKRYDGRADLYGLGVMLYELTTGRLPFMTGDAWAVISQHVHAPIVPPRAINEDIPPKFDALIVSLLSKEPLDRPTSAVEVLATIDTRDILAAEAVTAEEFARMRQIGHGRLIGRDGQLGQARILWGRVLTGFGQNLLLSGEAGIGKSCLMREIGTHVQVSGGQVLVGSCYAEGGLPYAPFTQIIRAAFEGDYVQDLELPDFVLADLLSLVPALLLSHPEFQPYPDLQTSEIDQPRMFENLSIFFSRLSDKRPLLLLIEDAHWADNGTLSLFRYLARQTSGRRMMIVMSYRNVGSDRMRLLHEILLDLNRERLVTQISLPPLDREQTNQMLALLFSDEITQEFLEGIYNETEGNPFYIEEVCKALQESGELSFVNGQWYRPSLKEIGIPQNVQVAINSRIRALSPRAQEVLLLAAVIGRDFDHEILSKANTFSEESLVNALEEAERAQLITGVGQSVGGSYSFVQAMIPATILENSGTLQRRQYHRQVAAAIALLRPGDDEALSQHYA